MDLNSTGDCIQGSNHHGTRFIILLFNLFSVGPFLLKELLLLVTLGERTRVCLQKGEPIG